jgi:hypothetical protein
VAGKALTSAILIALLGGAWAWSYVRVRILRQSGQVATARRYIQRNSLIMGGALVLALAETWEPSHRSPWLAVGGIILGVSFVLLLIHQIREGRSANRRS